VSARGPLDGLTILVTRPTTSASRLSVALENEGARVIELPTIQIDPPEDWAPLDAAILAGEFDWVVFTSANAVEMFLDRLTRAERGPEWFARSQVAAIGPETAAHLRSAGVTPALVPDEYVAEALVAEMGSAHPLSGRRILLPTAENARETLAQGLVAEGAIVQRVTAYRTVAPEASTKMLEELQSGVVNVITFTSASTVHNLVTMLSGHLELLRRTELACIGPVTAAAARDHGLEPGIIATTYTIPGLVAAIRDSYAHRPAAVRGGDATS
jgi:uroporphyrinogen-III synthase